MTFDDPKMYTKPFTVKIPHELLADSDVFEILRKRKGPGALGPEMNVVARA